MWASEALQVVDWILQRVSVDETAPRKLRKHLAHLWAPALLNKRIPLEFSWAILKNAMAIDRRALGRLVRPALTALRLTLGRRWRSLRGTSRTPMSRSLAADARAYHAERKIKSSHPKSCTVSIVPNYNHRANLRRRIDSMLAQAHSDFELMCSMIALRTIVARSCILLRQSENKDRIQREECARVADRAGSLAATIASRDDCSTFPQISRTSTRGKRVAWTPWSALCHDGSMSQPKRNKLSGRRVSQEALGKTFDR